ncbi:enolase-phosphatase E1-like isoform X2 [Uloborus diversus]|uniref:enolase-phosphatase E1-like isoform X2 n=1 Tax=Uloborus diversus TaxID=327109 RepID=UPI00240A41AF|nr:enolase-phosphatase E1-like isoform X2 [Uloborus diversus]
MKFRLITLIILASLMMLNDAGPLRSISKRSAFYIANETGPLRSISKRSAFYIANETACVVDNIVYSNGEPIPTDDPCEACKCRPPGFACVLKECEIKPGCRAVRRAGYCCPEYFCGCEHNGRMYRDGDQIEDSPNPCLVCFCQGSSIACSHVDCLYRVDCAPEYESGACCPHYNNCISANSGDEELNTVQTSSEQPPSVTTLFTILTEESTPSEETFSPESAVSSEIPQDVGSKVIGPFVLVEKDGVETLEPVEKTTTQNGENDLSNDETDLDHDTAVKEPENNISLNSGMDLNVEESKEEAKEEVIMTVEDGTNPEVVVLTTEESKALEDALSETTAPFAELPSKSEDSTENVGVTWTIHPSMEDTVGPEEKRKSKKFPESEEVSTDIVSKENFEPITDQSEEQTSSTETLVKDFVTSRGTEISYFDDELSTEKIEASSEVERSVVYEEIEGEKKEPMDVNDGITEKSMEEVTTNEEKKPRAEENEETVTLVVLVKDEDVQQNENSDEPKEGEQPVEEVDKSVEEVVKSVEEVDKSVEEAEKPMKEAELPVDEVELSVEEVDQSVEEVDQPVAVAEYPVIETQMSGEEVDLSKEEGEQPIEGLDQSDEKVDQPTDDGLKISSAPENRYKALDEAILSAFVPDDSSSVDESLVEEMSPATEINETVEMEATSDQAELLVTFVNESAQFPGAEVTAMNVGEMIGTESEQIKNNTKVGENDGE